MVWFWQRQTSDATDSSSSSSSPLSGPTSSEHSSPLKKERFRQILDGFLSYLEDTLVTCLEPIFEEHLSFQQYVSTLVVKDTGRDSKFALASSWP